MNLTNAAMKVILLTGATDGIGYEAAKLLLEQGHQVLLHGRSPDKLSRCASTLRTSYGDSNVETYLADLSNQSEVRKLAQDVKAKHDKIDVLINNAGVLKTSAPRTSSGLDVRFAVNTIAPYMLTKDLLPLIPKHGRVVNLSSAAQNPVNLEAMQGKGGQLPDYDAYAQSKLAIAMWNFAMSQEHPQTFIALNPASLIGTKMVKEGFGVEGKSLNVGAEIIASAAVSKKFDRASGKYFDNDKGDFGPAHPDATNKEKCRRVVETIEHMIQQEQCQAK